MHQLSEGKGKTGLFGRLGEVLTWNCQVTDLEGVLGDEAFHGPSSILDGEFGSILLVGRGSTGVVL